ncbi:YqjF family protein [Chitinophaga sancti]|uniref:DUF2071 domain-containing protein n=1 Tax=Chitinophaga sancti TaxID=1004 RepID=A0A1K1SAD2_9BACT|nr:DUF2071 domain-containing protein [Chitinophaga sancti]WQD60872.1 DUF2071 domain-containing protein [Chitinophaga sancti]WQG87000.1 DUF2071 domain-containing protein [Chitinophaga sancti]SFW81262.1 hypothetical protein SAMN05661012_05073 [Chitinophaga sancti]
MQNPFLAAEWRNLLMINFQADPAVLKAYVPYRTELDTWNDNHYVSLVGFMFQNTRVMGFSIPFHRHFEEVNLRFYVRYKDGATWKRGVVFIKELVPKRAITFVANTIYKEKYATHPMRHRWSPSDEALEVSYEWKAGAHWNHLTAKAEVAPQPITAGSEAAFITDHYWGYTHMGAEKTGEYQVTHPQWKTHGMIDYSYQVDTAALYGNDFVPMLSEPPISALLAEGSEITVLPKRIL